MTSERLPSFTTNLLDSKSIFSSFKRRTSPAKALYEKMATFFSWQGKSADELREHGVDFVVKNTLLRSVVVGSDGNERITTFRILTKKGTATLISVYVHTLYTADEVKDAFYEKLNIVIRNVPKHDDFIVLGDFNARVGANHHS